MAEVPLATQAHLAYPEILASPAHEVPLVSLVSVAPTALVAQLTPQ